MTTMTDETTNTDPNIQTVDDFERSSLDAPEGVFRFRLGGSYGLMETKNGKKYLNAMFILEQEAVYDENGNLTEVIDLKRPHRIFQKFFIENPFGTERFNSWLQAVGYKTTGTLDPATGRYVFHKDEALLATVDKTAWNRIYHKHDDAYGWSLELAGDFRTKPQSKVRTAT